MTRAALKTNPQRGEIKSSVSANESPLAVAEPSFVSRRCEAETGALKAAA
jgi:hypothetical protein